MSYSKGSTRAPGPIAGLVPFADTVAGKSRGRPGSPASAEGHMVLVGGRIQIVDMAHAEITGEARSSCQQTCVAGIPRPDGQGMHIVVGREDTQ
ncbi:hypothetical protein KIPB_011873, partial [Kipferlia bialata]|eukprot:g11873.t1